MFCKKELIAIAYELQKLNNNVSEIKVIGHSINDIDLPYYKIISQKTKKDAKWNIFFKDKDSMLKQYGVRKETLINLGVNNSCITPFLMNDIEL